MFEHTPGPWGFYGEPHGYHVGRDMTELALVKASEPVARITGQDTVEQEEANARLIAAAPELLEACETCLRLLESEDLDANKFDGEARRKLVPRLPGDLARRRSQAELLRAAVAKATG
jgi:hypothetical protein